MTFLFCHKFPDVASALQGSKSRNTETFPNRRVCALLRIDGTFNLKTTGFVQQPPAKTNAYFAAK
jgi:hypothetical protein